MVHDVGDREWIKAFYDSAAEWWGESWYEGENLEARLQQVRRFAGEAPKNLLELGAGTGETAAFFAAAGYHVTAVDLSDKNYALLSQVAKKHTGVTAVQEDFYTAVLPGKYDAVCLFETFGMGTDLEQRALLKRASAEWLLPGGVVIMDVYHPYGPVRTAGSSQHLDRLENVPGSVDMTERTGYDPVLGRWVDVWEPVAAPEHARQQSIRCYTPADLLLLLEGTGLKIAHAEFAGKPFELQPARVSTTSPLCQYEKNYAYTVILQACESPSGSFDKENRL